MKNKPLSFAKAAQIKPRRARKIGQSHGLNNLSIEPQENIILKHLNIGVDWFDGKDRPEPWIWASAFTIHLFIVAIFISVPPMEFKDRQTFGVEIIIPPETQEPPKPEETPIVPPTEPKLQKQVTQEKLSETSEESTPAEIEPEQTKLPSEVQIAQPQEVQKLEEIKPKQVLANSKINSKTTPINEIKTPLIEENIEEEIEEIRTPEPVTLEPVQKLQLKNNTRLEAKSSGTIAPINIGARSLDKSKAAPLPNIDSNLNIDTQRLEREAQEREAAQNAREQALKEQAARDNAAKISQSKQNNNNTAPIAKNGELAPPSSAGVTAIATNSGGNQGNSAPNSASGNPSAGGGQSLGGANNSDAGGPLPRGPRIVGKGRNVFESNENNSLLARMGRTADCSSINRERDEKCPNWEPIEKASRPIPAPIPKEAKRPATGIDPLPSCPLGTPQSNIGITCLPSKSAPNGRTQ